jgi:hypothetical protein
VPSLSGLDLPRVRRRDRGELARRNEPPLEKVHLTVELELVGYEEIFGKADRTECFAAKETLVGEVVDREDDGSWLRAGGTLHLAQVDGHERGWPIVRVHDVEGGTRQRALAHELGRRTRKDGKTTRVVGIVLTPLAVDPLAVVESGRVEEQELDARAEPPVVDGDLHLLLTHRKDQRRQAARDEKTATLEPWKAGYGEGDLVPELPECLAQCRHDIGESPHLGEGRELGGGKQDVHRARV